MLVGDPDQGTGLLRVYEGGQSTFNLVQTIEDAALPMPMPRRRVPMSLGR